MAERSGLRLGGDLAERIARAPGSTCAWPSRK
jgi:hypothetical protein